MAVMQHFLASTRSARSLAMYDANLKASVIDYLRVVDDRAGADVINRLVGRLMVAINHEFLDLDGLIEELDALRDD